MSAADEEARLSEAEGLCPGAALKGPEIRVGRSDAKTTGLGGPSGCVFAHSISLSTSTFNSLPFPLLLVLFPATAVNPVEGLEDVRLDISNTTPVLGRDESK